MTSLQQNAVRCQRVGWMLGHLQQRLRQWTLHRRTADSDAAGQYIGRQATQLLAVGQLLDGSLTVLRGELDALDRQSPPDEVFHRCRQVGDAVVWLERVWQYFASRFDQRDSPDPRAATVATADEMVWSCYRPLYEHPRVTALGLPRRPPPLAYVEPSYSPAARMTSGSLERTLEPSAAFDALEGIAGKLPIPLLLLPPWCVDAPWWLVFVAHEVGHHLQHEMEWVGPCRKTVEALAEDEGASQDDIERWGRWGEEVFADLCSLLLMGPWALWALVEVELRPAAAMVRRRKRYPPAWVRLRWMSKALRHLGLDPQPALRGLDLDLPADASKQLHLDVAIGDRLITLVDHPWPGGGKLGKLLRFEAADYADGGTIDQWADQLLSDAPLRPPRHLDTARQIIAGSLAAWAKLSHRSAPETLQESSVELAQRTMDAVGAASPPGTRSTSMPTAMDPTPGRLLGARVLSLVAQRADAEVSLDFERDGE